MRRSIIGLLSIIIFGLGAAYVVASDGMTALINTPISITGPDAVCKKVTNNSATGLSAYVPTASTGEWQSFVANPPSGVTVGSCCAGVTMNGQCWYKGEAGQTCDTVCASHAGCNKAGTETGADSTLCQALGVALSPGVPYYGPLVFGYNCFDAYPNIAGRKIGLWPVPAYAPPNATCSSNPIANTKLFCACNN